MVSFMNDLLICFEDLRREFHNTFISRRHFGEILVKLKAKLLENLCSKLTISYRRVVISNMVLESCLYVNHVNRILKC